MPEETYTFTEQTYEALAAAGVTPLAALDVLHGQRRIRRHIGSSLQIAGQDRDGAWLVVALVERDDDEYKVSGARWLDDDEVTALARMMGGQG